MILTLCHLFNQVIYEFIDMSLLLKDFMIIKCDCSMHFIKNIVNLISIKLFAILENKFERLFMLLLLFDILIS